MEDVNLRKISVILDQFDFEKVHAYMLLTDWKWARDKGYRTPTVAELMAHAEAMLIDVYNSPEPSSCHGSGGINAYKFPWGFKLTFEPVYKSSY